MKKSNLFINLCVAVLALLPLTARAADYVPQILAGVVYSEDWGMTDPREGFYTLEAIPGGKLTAVSTERDVYAAPMGGAVYADGKMQGIHFRTIDDPMSASGYAYVIYSVEYDLATFTQTKRKTLSDMYGNLISSCGMTHDPATGVNYGIFFNFDMNYNVIDRKFCTIDFTSDIPKKKQIRVMAEAFAAIAAGDDGRLYGVSREGYLYTINKSTGNLTLLGDLGVQDISANPSSMTFDPKTKKLYWCYVSKSNKSYLYEINYKIGEVGATKIMDVPGNSYLVNMYIAAPEAGDGAPAAVSGLALDFKGESYTGTVSFAMPDKSYDGEALTGELDYVILEGEKEVKTGKAAAGAEVTETVTLEGGMTTVTVYASNSAGNGAPVSEELHVGLDTPTAVGEALFAYDADKKEAALSWSAPLRGVNGKEMSALTYDVVRMPGNVKVASGIASASFTEPLENDGDLKAFWYEITPVNGGKFNGESAASNKVVIGNAMTVPFDDYFTNRAMFDIYTVVDANNDGATWKYHHYTYTYSGGTENYARMDAHKENADDDWLLLPQLTLEAGGVYEISFTAKKQFLSEGCNQLLEVAAGRGTDVKKFNIILDPTVVADVNFAPFKATFSADADADYHFAIHAISDAGSAALDLDEVHVKQLASGKSPVAPTDITLVPDPKGLLKAEVSMTAPTEKFNGDKLAKVDRIEVLDAEERVLGSVADVAAGAKATVQITGLANGYATFTVRAVHDGINGEPAEVRGFIGQDVPVAPTAVKLSDNGTEAILTWEAPTKGVNGLTVNPELMTFNLYEYDEVYKYFKPLQKNIASPYKLDVKTAEGDQALIYCVIKAETTGGESEAVFSNSLIVGKPFEAPYAQSFADCELGDDFVWLEGERADWNIYLTREHSSDNDGGAVWFVPNVADFGTFCLGKISLAGIEKPAVSFDYYVYPGSYGEINVAADKYPQGETETLHTIKYKDMTAEGWQRASVDLSAYKDEPFVLVKFAMAASDKEAPVILDNIRIGQDAGSGVGNVSMDAGRTDGLYDVYGIDGRLVLRNAESLQGLAPGLYIVNGKKVHIQ